MTLQEFFDDAEKSAPLLTGLIHFAALLFPQASGLVKAGHVLTALTSALPAIGVDFKGADTADSQTVIADAVKATYDGLKATGNIPDSLNLGA